MHTNNRTPQYRRAFDATPRATYAVCPIAGKTDLVRNGSDLLRARIANGWRVLLSDGTSSLIGAPQL